MVLGTNGSGRIHDATSFLAFTVAYAVFAYFGLNWAMVDGAGSAIWPAAGIGLAGLLLGGKRFWPAIVIGRTIAAIISGSQQPFLADVFLGLANAIATLAACFLIQISGGLKPGLPSFGDVIRYVLAGALPYAIIVAAIGLFTLKLSSGISLDIMWLMFVPCVIGHFVGAATIGTLILTWWRTTRPISSTEFAHFIAIFAATAIATRFTFFESSNGSWPTWQLLPFLVWTAIVFGVRGTSITLATISFIAILETGIIWLPGPSPTAHMSGQIWMLQQFLATTALTMLLLAAAVDELRSQAELKRRDLMLREAMTAGATGIFRWTFGSNQVECDETLLRLLGTPPEHAPKRLQDLIAVLHPDDQLRILTTYEDCARNGSEISTTTRVMSKDGQSRTLNVRGRCVEHPMGPLAFVTGAVVDITERKRAEAREQLLSREVNHRSKNVLAVVQAIIQLTDAPNMQAYRARISGRIQNLSRTHNLLAESKWDGVMLKRLIHDELSPFETDEGAAPGKERFAVSGPDIILKPAAAQAFALILHEMLTNAVKYGALTALNGRVQISWSHMAGSKDMLCFKWREWNGPATSEPDRAGFGWTVIRSSVEEQMRGTLTKKWTETGLSMVIEIPMDEVSDTLTSAPALSAA